MATSIEEQIGKTKETELHLLLVGEGYGEL